MKTTMITRAALLIGAGSLLAAAPVGTQFEAGLWTLGAPAALAKNGADDRGDDDRGRGGDRDRDDDDRGRGDDRDGDDDDRGRGRGADDDKGDDHGRRGRGADDGAHHTRSDNAATPQVINVGTVTKIESSAIGIEVRYSTGWKEEIENGRYELKNPAGRTVRERPATAEDLARLESLR